jgi:uncharacterized protein (DUF3084 family)
MRRNFAVLVLLLWLAGAARGIDPTDATARAEEAARRAEAAAARSEDAARRVEAAADRLERMLDKLERAYGGRGGREERR